MDLSALRSPPVVRGLLSLLAAILALAFPDLLGELLFILIGVAAVVLGVLDIREWRKHRVLSQLVVGLTLVAAGTAVLVGGDLVHRVLEWVVAGALALRSVWLVVRSRREQKDTGTDPFWGYATSALMLTLAVALLLIPHTVIHWVVVGIAIAWILGGTIVLINAVGSARRGEDVPYDVVGVIRQKSMAADQRSQVTDAIFEGWDSTEGTLRFSALMSFATAIATLGIKADSTAVVIGAMLIAPLMGPIMALSASILMGWPKRALYSGWRVALGVVIGVGGSYLMALVSPEFVAITSNSEVLGRVSPTLLDLLVALAAGAAGGYAMTHPEVGTSLPGVAIAVALAPPLAVVGVSLHATEFGFSAGAFLLFLTNLVGIVVASGFTFVISGYSPWTNLERSGEQARKSLILVGLAMALVAFPLAMTGEEILDHLTAKSTAEDSVGLWLGAEPEFTVSQLTLSGVDVDIVLVGPGVPPDVEELARDLSRRLDRDITVDLRVIPESLYSATVRRGEADSS